MEAQHVPANYSGVHYNHVLGIPIEFCIRPEVDNHPVNIVQNATGVSLKVQECEFKAIVEWKGHPKLSLGLYDPDRWHVGFVQNLTDGKIMFRYQGATEVLAAIAPQTVPCKDSGSAGTWYDPSPYSVKRLGVQDEFADDVPLPANHPARTNQNVRYVQMGDAPGTGSLPLRVPCASSRDARAVVGNDYTIAWTDPLNPNANDPAIGRLTGIYGSLAFRTCLAMSSDPDLARIRTTTLFCYLYYVDWAVDYTMNVQNGVVTARGVGGHILQQGLWTGALDFPIVTAPDANESVCVRFQ